MANWNINDIVLGLQQARHDWREEQHRAKEFGGRELPSKETLKVIIDDLCGVLFPMRLGPQDLRQESEDFYIAHTLDRVLASLFEQVKLTLYYEARYQVQSAFNEALVEPDYNLLEQQAQHIVQEFANALPAMRRILDTDVQAAFVGDPAARSVDEVLLCYPGMLAITHHRLAHQLYRLQVPLLARMIAEQAHSVTGIDIHPGAQIGKSFFIDHGTGVVIGETTIIGERVRIYQAVTLGAKRFETDEAGNLQKDYIRHPIVEDDVVIYAGATILGRVNIGKGSVIGGNVWLTRSVPANSQIMQGGESVSHAVPISCQ